MTIMEHGIVLEGQIHIKLKRLVYPCHDVTVNDNSEKLLNVTSRQRYQSLQFNIYPSI